MNLVEKMEKRKPAENKPGRMDDITWHSHF